MQILTFIETSQMFGIDIFHRNRKFAEASQMFSTKIFTQIVNFETTETLQMFQVKFYWES